MSPGALLLGLAAQATAGEYAGEIEIPRILPREDCSAQRSDGDIVVCGRRDDSEKHRLPGTGRSSAPWRQGQSWGAVIGEEEQRSRYGSQTVGPFGYLQYGRQQVREWRLEREQMAKAKRDEARQVDRAGAGKPPF